MEPEDVRRAYTSASQRNPSHRQGVTSSKHSSYFTQPGRAETLHFSPSEPPMVAYGARRRSHDDHPEKRDQRRNSADLPAGRHPYHSHTLPRSLSQSHQELHRIHEFEDGSRRKRGMADQTPPNSSHHSRSRERRAMSSSMRTPLEPGSMADRRSSNLRGFEDSGSESEDGGSQNQEVSPCDIHITVEDDSSTASSSTLVSVGGPQRAGMYPGAMGSQELFDDDAEFMSLSTLAEGIPMSSQPHYYDHFGFEQETGSTLTRHDSNQGLSQPSLPLRSKHGRHRMSLSDLSSLGNSSSNLTHSQYLSQSVAEVPRYAHRGEVPGHRLPDNRPRHVQSFSHGYLNRMQSDPHLNAADGPPGQQRSIIGAMKRMREEEKQKRRNQQQRRHQQESHSSPSSSPRSQPSQRRQKPSSPQTVQQPVPPQMQQPPHNESERVKVTQSKSIPTPKALGKER